MLSKSFIEKLSDLTKIPVEKMTEAIASEQEVDLSTYEITHKVNGQDETVKVSDILAFTPGEHKQAMKNAGNTAVEMAVKEVRNELGLNFTGKTAKNLADAAMEIGKKQGFEEAGKEPTKANEELKSQLTAARESLKKAEQERDQAMQSSNTVKFESTLTRKLGSKLPKDVDLPWDIEELKSSFRTNREVSEEGGVIGVKVNGEFERDKLGNIIPVEQVFETWLTPKIEKMIPPDRKGRGTGTEKRIPGQTTDIEGIKTSEDFYKYCKDNEIPEGKQPEILVKVRKTNPAFLLE